MTQHLRHINSCNQTKLKSNFVIEMVRKSFQRRDVTGSLLSTVAVVTVSVGWHFNSFVNELWGCFYLLP